MKCLFHAVTPYHLLEMITFRLHSHPDAEAVLVLYQFLANQLPKLKELEKFFNRVVVIESRQAYTSDNKLKKNCLNYFDDIFSGSELGVQSFDEIFVAGAQFPFGAYLVSRGRKFVFFEEAAGGLFEPSILKDICRCDPRGRDAYRFCSANGLYDGSCPLITARFCNLDAQTKPPIEGLENIRHFSVVDALGELSQETREKIIRFYLDDSSIQVPEDSVLVLTEHQANLLMMTLDEECLLYQLLADYFFPGRKMLFKPHPSSTLHLEYLFPDSVVIRKKFPSELIPFVFSSRPSAAATVYSRSICNLGKYFDRILSLTHEFEVNGEFHYIHRYFAAFEVCRKLGGELKTIHQLGADHVLLERLSGDEVEFPAFDPAKEWKYLIVGRPEAGSFTESIPAFLENLPDDRAVVFLNLDNAYPFYEPGQASPWEHLVPLELHKVRRREDEFYSDCEPETIWLYTKNRKFKETAEGFTMEKELKNAGLAIQMASLTPDQRQIKILEGIIAAMEVRMQALIKENSKLKGKSQKI